MSSKAKKEAADPDYYENDSKTSIKSNFDQSSSDSEAYSDDDVKPVLSDASSDSDDSDSKPFLDNNDELPIDIPPNMDESSLPESWPTIAILPGGVITNNERRTTRSSKRAQEDADEEGVVEEGIYACAKCPATFNDLLCLTKHIRTHSTAKRKASSQEWNKLTMLEKQLIEIKRSRLEMEIKYYKEKAKVMSKISNAMTEIGGLEDLLDFL